MTTRPRRETRRTRLSENVARKTRLCARLSRPPPSPRRRRRPRRKSVMAFGLSRERLEAASAGPPRAKSERIRIGTARTTRERRSRLRLIRERSVPSSNPRDPTRGFRQRRRRCASRRSLCFSKRTTKNAFHRRERKRKGHTCLCGRLPASAASRSWTSPGTRTATASPPRNERRPSRAPPRRETAVTPRSRSALEAAPDRDARSFSFL